jgi:prepilin-type N-terminal cleavage/methylation domain-containing protein
MIKHKLRQISPSSQSGFTIIESLVAILVVAILLAAVAPVIVLSAATRVQAKRIETATDAAKNYMDGVRSGIIAAPPSPITDSTTVADYAVPTAGSLTCSSGNAYCTTPATNLYCVDLDNDGACTKTSSQDLVIQAVRYNKAIDPSTIPSGTPTNIIDPKKGYQLGIRVYRADGFADTTTLKKTRIDDSSSNSKQSTFAAGLGDRKTPLVEMTTEISNKTVIFTDFCTRLRQTNPQSTCS